VDGLLGNVQRVNERKKKEERIEGKIRKLMVCDIADGMLYSDVFGS
jgi:hypothetical protein